jgi:pullulanase/glycogen debranching enzyme
MRVWPGQPYPLGATWTGLGVNFAIYSAYATRVELCLFDSSDAVAPPSVVPLPEHTNMPVHHHAYDRHLVDHGLANYWGYNTLSFFAPDLRYSSGSGADDSVREFKRMVKALHSTGLEVILDVVYNHTAEGNHLGPTLSLRGVDNASYYRLVPEDKGITSTSPAAGTR